MATVWLGASGWMVLAAVDLPLPVRLGICICAATINFRVIGALFLHRGPGSVRALRWSEDGEFRAVSGPGNVEYSVSIGTASFRLGRRAILLWLETCNGSCPVFIDEGMQDSRDLRRLCRSLGRPLPESSGEPARSS